MAVIAIALIIVLATPQYAVPMAAGAGVADPSESPSPDADDAGVEVATAILEPPTSKPPGKLKGYRWPVRGGMIARYYEPHPKGDFQIDGERVHDGIVITWFDGAVVKAAHGGEVVAAGRDWARHVGFQGSLDKLYRSFAPIDDPKKARKSSKPWFPRGVVIDDGNGYYSVYTEIKDLLVKPGQKVKAGQPIGYMSKAEGMQMMRYRLVRMDGLPMRVHNAARKRGFPNYAAERVDPLAVLKTDAKRMPQIRRQPPQDPPRLSEY
ncbi:MAG: peptidoglycan DD-metalloendopeptidase family protein [Candidatus Limnocylindrales bacterium]